MLPRWGFILGLIALYLAGWQLSQWADKPIWIVPALMGLVFVGLVAAMYLRVLPALLALPVLAVALASIAGMHWKDIFTHVVEEGGVRLQAAILAAILGSVLAQIVEKTGIAQTAVKKTAELGGDNPIVLAVLLTVVSAILFSTLSGLGAVIMVATIVLPILLSLGLRPLYVGCLFLLSLSLGGAFNMTNWELYKTTLGLANAQISVFAIPFAILMLITVFLFLLIEGKRLGKSRYKAEIADSAPQYPFVPWYALLTPLVPLVPVLFFVLLPKVYHKPAMITVMIPAGTSPSIHYFLATPAGATINGYFSGRRYSFPMSAYSPSPFFEILNGDHFRATPGKYSVRVVDFKSPSTLNPGITPISTITVDAWSNIDLQIAVDAKSSVSTVTPNVISTAYDFPISVALLLGIIFGAITTYRKGQSTVQLITRSAFDGVGAVGPALVLMLGIGMVLKATMSPEVSAVIQPMLKGIVPQGHSLGAMAAYIALFAVLAPLALYRGPLNLWGMGAGLIGALNGLMPAGAIMGAFMSVGMIQGVCDPTNTHNVWIANYTNTDVQDILKRTLPYMWILALVGLILSAALYYRG